MRNKKPSKPATQPKQPKHGDRVAYCQHELEKAYNPHHFYWGGPTGLELDGPQGRIVKIQWVILCRLCQLAVLHQGLSPIAMIAGDDLWTDATGEDLGIHKPKLS